MATLSDYNGQDSFTIGGNSFNNRASSGTPIYERIGGGGASGETSGGTTIETFDFGDTHYGNLIGLGSLSYMIGDESLGKPIDSTKTYYVFGCEGFEHDQEEHILEGSSQHAPTATVNLRNVRVPDLSHLPLSSNPMYHNNDTLQTAPELSNHAAIMLKNQNLPHQSIDHYAVFIYNGKLYCNMGGPTYSYRIHFLAVG